MKAQSSVSSHSPLSRRALRDGVYDILLEMLLAGEFEPGAPLGIDSLSRRLEVSPTPIREALVQLEHTGLVSRAALKGYRVAPPLSVQQMRELFDARLVVEVAAATRAASAHHELVAELREAHDQHQSAAEGFRNADSQSRLGEYRRYFEADWNFHETILRHCGNRFLQQMAQMASTHTHRLRQSARHGSDDMSLAIAEHAEILQAFERGDGSAASEAMDRHIRGAQKRALAEEN
ncbi:GntR family transcriptional regulator [Arthrobacter sp.]|uniref:GntR family transcriptional regulator n=1 Tax=Arthrobacter sp. TaxID=1667 RepID=UPI002811379F|nr:GntR family transcriptional regulator [Arthrobacter sp.]